jgi:DNA-binding IclR family transcriptional regulator
MTTDQQHGLSVATKLFRILAAFTADHPRLRASEVCRRSGLPFSTVHRILTELVSHGVLDHAPDGTYAVGIRLWEVATLNPQLASLRGVATPWMHELYSMLRCRVCLDVRVGVQGLRVEELNGVGVHSCHRLGTRFPIRSTVGGHVLLAYAGSQVLEAVLAAPPARPVEDDVIYPHGLRQGLASIRGSGVAVSESQSHVTVAGPVFGPAGGIVAALEVDAPAPDDLLRLDDLFQGVHRRGCGVSDRWRIWKGVHDRCC